MLSLALGVSGGSADEGRPRRKTVECGLDEWKVGTFVLLGIRGCGGDVVGVGGRTRYWFHASARGVSLLDTPLGKDVRCVANELGL